MIKDSEEKQVASTGATRSSSKGRGRPSLLPFDALMELAIHFEEGAEVHAPRGWEKGLPLSWYLDSMFRHLTGIMMGDTSESHERAYAWNAVCFLATWVRIKNGTLPAELDDLPHHVASGGDVVLREQEERMRRPLPDHDREKNVRIWIEKIAKHDSPEYRSSAFTGLLEIVTGGKPLAIPS